MVRVLLVALSLLTYPRDDPGVEQWDDITTAGMQEHEERLLRGGDKLDHEMAPNGKTKPRDDFKTTESDQHVAEKDKTSVLEDMTVAKQEEDNVDPKLSEGGDSSLDLSLPQDSKSESETALKASQTDHEQKREDFTRLHTKTTDNETSEKAIADWERDYLWYIWNTFSIISMIRLFRKYLGRNSQMQQEGTRPFPVTCTAAAVPLPDDDTLQRFHSKYVQVSSDKKWREEEFLEGFANDLLDAMRTVCDKNGGMVIEDFQMVDGCDIIVPFSPPDPYSFQCLLRNNQAADLLPDMQVCGQIKLVEHKKVQNGCPCQSPDADDMVCLLHCETDKVEMELSDVFDGLLCMKNSPFLSKSQVTRWFQSTIKQAWALISHKYEFELNIRYIDAPGALVVRFRSGKRISFSMNPVVKFNTDAHFFITPCSPNNLDTFWTLSLTNYEDRFLDNISKRLPDSSCHSQTLEIAHFLHRTQAALSGSSALKVSHFKTALMHLLLTKDPSEWKPNNVTFRLRDLLDFMEKSLQQKLLHHVLIGNPLTQKVIELPAEFTQAKTMNLFHPLVVHDCIYRNTVMHFQEMLQNAHVLIHEYVDKCTDRANCLT